MKKAKSKILVIEDDKVVRENTAELLELAQYEVKTAANGKLGVQIVKEFQPDIILCDIMMPELDGYGVLHILAKDPQASSIPFIFITAKAEKSELRKGMELGADDYLTKPFTETELLNAIETRLKKSALIKNKSAQQLGDVSRFFEEIQETGKLDKLSQQRALVRYKKREVIFREGEKPQFLFFLHQGKAKSVQSNDEGKAYITTVHKAGEFFGYIPLFENGLYTDSAEALEDCELYKIPKEDFIALIYQDRDVAARFIKLIANNITEKEKKLLSLAYDTVRKRVANALLLLQERYQETSGRKVRISLNRDDLASLTGTATETLIRTLSEFKADELIEVEGREIIILDTGALQAVP